MEAATYLGEGFGIRNVIEAREDGWVRIGDLARVWMPGRLKGIQVAREVGTPFLAATQIFDLRPTPRKWLALERTSDASNRFVQSGTILVTCSGTVGRTMMSYAPHENTLISHDLLRVEPIDAAQRGWLYACLHAQQVRAMATGAQYGHIIKHLEVPHLAALPVPTVDAEAASRFAVKFDRILELRNSSYALRQQADAVYAGVVGEVTPTDSDLGFSVSSAQMVEGRRRLEAAYHAPAATAIARKMKRFDRLSEITERVWWMPRFKRYYGDAGMPYLSADELFTANPPGSKKILVAENDSHPEYFIRAGWIVMACSGQIYGMNGAAALMTNHHENVFFSHDLIRIIPDADKVRAGYLLIALTHPTHGRPLLIRAAYGTSIPHLDPGDVADFQVARVDRRTEDRIADMAEESARQWAEADALEREIGADATALIDRFLQTPVRYTLSVPRRMAAE